MKTMHLIAPPATSDKLENVSETEFVFNEEEEECAHWPLAVQLSRTTMQLIDYKMFIAARRIQSFWRGHRVRKLIHQRWKAAVTIQRWWRGFRVRRTLWKHLEQRLQDTVLGHFHRAAVRIQALFRGWRARRTIHDVQNLRRMQATAAEDLVNCVILQLHHIKKTESLPGLFSLRDSVILSRVDKLITTMMFRFHNGRVLSIVANKMSQREEHRRNFEDGRFYNPFPYAGPNFNELCHVVDEGKVVTKDLTADLRFAGIVAKFEESHREEHLRETHRRFDTRKIQEQLDNINAQEVHSQRKFCADVIESMRKWSIWSGANVNAKQNIFQSPAEVDRFFNRAKHIMSDYNIIAAEDLVNLEGFQEDFFR
ncbi:uncharacterized protein LOC108032440 isoform X2 [Drosophila biarmipes]|uniref:uncharacterized protein LOC108032440 isoform X2 n=1 Tax=Drosophila biarmipes TaxID=125945 RepID=UPI0007E70CE2|nr:uncharacterized protein LOC108032440 isoform X2 [Drosophila biarmipes]